MKAVIVGGGIGGLSSGLCFHEFGWDVELLEQAPALDEIGAGIQISPNGMKIFQALGIAKQVEKAGFMPRASQFRMGESGRVIMTNKMGGEMTSRFGAPYIHIHRADLIGVLSEALENRVPGVVRTGAAVTGYGQDGSKAWAILQDSSKVEGDVLVGADGIQSAIRAQMMGAETPRFTGNVAWRAVVPVERLGRNAPLPVASVWLGSGRHAVTYLLRGGTLANFVGVVERNDWQKESWSEQGEKKDVLADFAGWHPTITTLIEQADEHYRWALYDREPLDYWSDGRVTLLGDACHPMLPFIAQGAVQAIEDGYVLARALAENDNLTAALSGYFETRQPRTRRIQAAARANMEIFHQRTVGGKLATYGPMWFADKLRGTEAFDQHMSWLLGHDVTA